MTYRHKWSASASLSDDTHILLRFLPSGRQYGSNHLLLNTVKNKHIISPLLHDLHWLRVPKFRLAVLMFQYRNKTAPEYLARSYSGQPRRQQPHEGSHTVSIISGADSLGVGLYVQLVMVLSASLHFVYGVWNDLPGNVSFAPRPI